MGELVRFGVSIDGDLLAQFDQHIAQTGAVNRSEAVRDLIRDRLVEAQWDHNEEIVGVISMVYDHHTRELLEGLTHIQHSFPGQIMSVLHIHLDHHNCLEVLVVRGKSRQVSGLADTLVGTRGVKHGKLTMTTTGLDIPVGRPAHSHDAEGHEIV